MSQDRATKFWLKMEQKYRNDVGKFLKEDPWSWRTTVKNEDFKGQILKQVYA